MALYVFYGGDQFRAREELSALRAKLDTEGDLANNTVRLEARGLTPADLRNASHAASFFATTRLVIVDGLQGRFSGQRSRGARRPTARAATKEPPATELDQFVAVLSELPESTTVVLLDESPAKAFVEAVTGIGTLREFSQLRNEDLRRWAQDRVRSLGYDFQPAALDRLVYLFDGAHVGELAQELDKLATYASGRAVTVADVEDIVAGAVAHQIWDLTDNVIAGRADRALGFLQRNARSGREEYAPQQLISSLARQYRQLLVAQALLRDGFGQQQVAERLGLSQYPLRKVMEQAPRASADRLEAAYRRILGADVAIKTSTMDADAAMELLIADLCELTRRSR